MENHGWLHCVVQYASLMEFHEMHFLVIMNKMGKITTVIYKLLTASLGMWVMATFLKKFRGFLCQSQKHSLSSKSEKHWPAGSQAQNRHLQDICVYYKVQ